MQLIKEFIKNDYRLLYLDCDGQTALQLLPAGTVIDLHKKTSCEPLLHAFVRGDVYGGQFTNGLSRRMSETTKSLVLDSLTAAGDVVTAKLHAANGLRFEHEVTLLPECVQIQVTAINAADRPLTLEYLTSFSLGGITPVCNDEEAGALKLVRLRAYWSGEGRKETAALEQLGLEPVAGYHMDRVVKFGAVGSMPVKSFYPRACIEDSQHNLCWGFDLDAPATWQMECIRKDRGAGLTGGLGDEDFGAWHKTLAPGESFSTPLARLTVCEGGSDRAFQRLVRCGKNHLSAPLEADMPFIYNEYCTTGGNPTAENIKQIARRLTGAGFTYLVIDAGWYVGFNEDWGRRMGDWEVNPDRFPGGFKEVCDCIRAAGMIPGLWFEPEVVGCDSKVWDERMHLLRKNSEPITVLARRFWDMTDPWVQEYLHERVIKLLKDNGFGFIKVDYNDNIGLGADGDESLGEKLRRNQEASRQFFLRMREEIPDLVIENCSSGACREESAFLRVSDMTSFSDCSDGPEVPVIAANERRCAPAEQIEIWAVLPANLSDDELYYRLISPLYGRFCLSGSIYDLSEAQWDIVKKGLAFYKAARFIIKNSEMQWLTPEVLSYRKLTGAQVTWQECGDEALLICHRFREDNRTALSLPKGWKVADSFGSGISTVIGDKLIVRPGGPAADAYRLIKKY